MLVTNVKTAVPEVPHHGLNGSQAISHFAGEPRSLTLESLGPGSPSTCSAPAARYRGGCLSSHTANRLAASVAHHVWPAPRFRCLSGSRAIFKGDFVASVPEVPHHEWEPRDFAARCGDLRCLTRRTTKTEFPQFPHVLLHVSFITLKMMKTQILFYKTNNFRLHLSCCRTQSFFQKEKDSVP